MQKILDHHKKEIAYGRTAVVHLNAAENLLLNNDARKYLYELAAKYCTAAARELDTTEGT
jgi:hypothetical protein